MQQPLLTPRLRVLYEVDSKQLGLDGKDLKRVARAEDQRDYAVKSLSDGRWLPLSEWVCYHLWRACALPTPDWAVLDYPDRPPAFGSQLEVTARQISKDPAAYTIAGFFGPHLPALAAVYPLDAFVTNGDRHGRNFLVRDELTGAVLLSIDFSRAWLSAGGPFGSVAAMGAGCQSGRWWSHFRTALGLSADHAALGRAEALDDQWLQRTIGAAPVEWRDAAVDAAACNFWITSRPQRAAFARTWCAA